MTWYLSKYGWFCMNTGDWMKHYLLNNESGKYETRAMTDHNTRYF